MVDGKTDDASAPAGTVSEEEQKAVNDAVLGADRAQGVPIEKTEEESEEAKPEKEGGEGEKESEEKPKEEKSEAPPAESEDEKRIAKILQQFKGDGKEVAKAYDNLQVLLNKQGTELGQLRRTQQEHDILIKRMETEPEAVAKELQQKTQLKNENLLDAAINDPTILPTFIKSEIQKVTSEFVREQQIETALEEQYPEYKDRSVKQQVEDVRLLVKSGKLPEKERDLWAVRGFNQEKKLDEVKKIVRQEIEEAQATKAGETVDKQGVVTGEKSEEESEEKIYQKTLIELER